MERMSPNPLRKHAADLATVAVIGATALGHLRYVAVDARYPTSVGLYYGDLPRLHAQLQHLAELPQALWSLVVPGDGYQLVLAAFLALVGRSPAAFALVDVGWSVAILVLTALLARRLAGPVAGTIATALTATFPMLVVLGRTHWIHVPEAALVLGALLAWWSDPGLARRRTVVALGILGPCVLLLRPTGMIWFGLLGIAMLVTALRPRGGGVPETAGPRWRRVGLVWGLWVLSALPQIMELVTYLGDKVGRRELYGRIVPPLTDQIAFALGPPVALMTAVGAAMALRTRRLRGWPLLLACALVPFILQPLFRVGIDNFVAGAAALAILAGGGLAAWPRTAVTASLLLFVAYGALQWLPAPAPGGRAGDTITALTGRPLERRITEPYLIYEGFGGADVEALLDATCPGRNRTCTVAADQGLFRPFGEEPGQLELFLTRWDSVDLLAIAEGHGEAVLTDQPLDALAHFDCPARDPMWRLRRPGSRGRLEGVIAAQGLEVAWSTVVDVDCAYSWYTPGGRVGAPERLPRRTPGPLSGGAR